MSVNDVKLLPWNEDILNYIYPKFCFHQNFLTFSVKYVGEKTPISNLREFNYIESNTKT